MELELSRNLGAYGSCLILAEVRGFEPPARRRRDSLSGKRANQTVGEMSEEGIESAGLSVPPAANPNISMAATRPVTSDPNGSMPRARCPTSAYPDPSATVPIPVAGDPVIIRAGCNGHHFDLGSKGSRWRYDGRCDLWRRRGAIWRRCCGRR